MFVCVCVWGGGGGGALLREGQVEKLLLKAHGVKMKRHHNLTTLSEQNWMALKEPCGQDRKELKQPVGTKPNGIETPRFLIKTPRQAP